MTTAAPLARYYFASTVREGLAAYITGSAAGERAQIEARLIPSVNSSERPEYTEGMTVGLYGPGDVLGFDPLVVTRTDPRLNVWDYEPNFMPMVEFSEPDLPWRFTPNVARDGDSGELMPWLTLIVLKTEGEHKGLGERLPDEEQKNGLPIRWIKQVEISALPNLEYAWLWAHVHVTDADDLSDNEEGLVTAVANRISEQPGTEGSHVVARLVCPRRLAPRTRYTAFVVPTFKIGQVAAGLISALPDEETAITPGWVGATGQVDLPYYYSWDFATSVRGDFEYLVTLLEPRPLEGLGKRAMDCASMPYEIPPCPGTVAGAEHVLELEGALMSPETVPGQWPDGTGDVALFRGKLAGVLNLPVGRVGEGTEEDVTKPPLVTPPIFGRRHAGQETVRTSDGPWLDDVNLDPRQRAAAGYGAVVVEKDQESLMASVWDQLGDIEETNDMLANGQLGLESSKWLFRRLNTLSLADFLWTTRPMAPRIRAPSSLSTSPASVSEYLDSSPIPKAAFDPAFRRVLRRRGGLRKRQRPVPPATPGRDLLSRLNNGDIAAAGAPPKPVGIPSMCDVTEAAIATLERETEPERRAAGKYRINGRVVDRLSRRGIAGVSVEAWDKDPFLTDLAGRAVTNARGSFRIDFDTSYYTEWRLDPKPDLFFRVFREGQPVPVVSPSVLRNVNAGDTTVVIEVETPGVTTAGNVAPFRVSGRVVDRATHAAVPWVRVEAWDMDPFHDDLVGSTTADDQGAFSVAFDEKFSREWIFDPRPDLYFKVFRGEQLLGHTAARVVGGVRPGATSVTVEIDAPIPPPTRPGPASDFCEAAITCQAVSAAVASHPALGLHADAGAAICAGIEQWLNPAVAPSDAPRPADLVAVRDAIKAAIAPWVTIPARLTKRMQLGPGVHQRGLLGRLESDIEFPQPMYEPLAAISQDLVLPGVERVPQNTISILKTNRRFMEAYMLGLNDSLTGEIIWRGAPVYIWTTFFRQFWDVRGLVEPGSDTGSTKDITRMATWSRTSVLGAHDPRSPSSSEPADRAVLLVRGDVLKRYPNTLVYAIETALSGYPALQEYLGEDETEPERLWPIFSGSLSPDLTFLGFDTTPRELCTGGPGDRGYFIVLEERLGEPRFGFDLAKEDEPLPSLSEGTWWYDMSWSHLQPEAAENSYIDGRSLPEASGLTPNWGASAAVMANVALQRPVRVAIHASKMLIPEVCAPPSA